jgi:hypothetical protein
MEVFQFLKKKYRGRYLSAGGKAKLLAYAPPLICLQ